MRLLDGLSQSLSFLDKRIAGSGNEIEAGSLLHFPRAPKELHDSSHRESRALTTRLFSGLEELGQYTCFSDHVNPVVHCFS